MSGKETKSVEEVSEQLREALQTLRYLRVTGQKPQGFPSAWPPHLRTFIAELSNGSREDLIVPAADAIDRMDKMLGLLLLLEPKAAQLVLARSGRPASRWRALSIRFGRSVSSLREDYYRALSRLEHAGRLNRS